MLWTLNGLLLLCGLGVVIGICGTLFVKSQEWEDIVALLGIGTAATFSVIYLIMQWLGPAGGGG